MKKFKLLSIALAGILAVGIAGCGKKTASDSKTIVIGVSPSPHKQIMEVAKPILEKEGYKVEIKEFNDYVQPNMALNNGELDANFFQHIPYLNQMVKEKNLDITATVKVHIEPMALYSKKIKKVEDLKNGATIAIPNDATNEARALQVLAKNNIIKIKDGELVTDKDITSNPKNLKFKPVEAAQVPRSLEDVDAAVINGNYAIDAGFNPLTDGLVVEESSSPYANVVAVRTKDKDTEKIKALDKALTSDEVKKFIEKQNGKYVPAF
ncbi:MAG: MetQ/NlpA family ABC transporter substrate-binding protein [Inconstantimicrobium porci]|uniref:Lipoprotein n=1 Tax=Inconstantimicrobium porci TaxID=2652291 RepID=A0A7X2MZ69_9CLOT|nr:MetQ/NlpA family ABC transporter substrate-binding protein [Inconstantimicrobium porci]MDY5911016.1 MetQ/NlpA family ABC transporter substrate-binding protein [Inconstantimicrobium porci]MSR91807.1 MetQ/NlpA family ABC transporter substrate-binding protein [Inconstantimicrobium porci]